MTTNLLYHMQKPLIKEKDGIILDINDLFLDLTEFNKNEICGKNIIEILDELFRCNDKTNITDGQTQTALFTKTFDVRFVKVEKHEDSNNNINLYIFNEIENSRLDTKLLFIKKLIDDNKIGIGIYTVDDIKLIKANQKYMNYLPKPFNTKEIVYGTCMKEFVPDFDKSKAKEVFTNVAKLNKSIYVTEKQGIMMGDNNYWDNTITPISENGKVKYILSILENVTERVLSRNHIQRKNKLISNQKKELEIIFENMSDGLAVMDRNGHYIKTNKALNKALTENTNISTVDRVGDTVMNGQKYYNDNDEELNLEDLPFYKVLKGETVKQQRIVIKNKLNKIYFNFNAVPVFDEMGNFQYGIIVIRNITEVIQKSNEIKQQQQLVIKSEQEKLKAVEKALAMKDEFISLISHEFKTPLNVIYSAIQLIEYIYIDDIPDKVKGLIKNIKQNTFRQLRLVNNLLDITRLNSGRFKLNIKNIDIVSLTKQICQSVRLYSDQKHINLIFTCTLNCKSIAIDDEKLERILLNLLSNAIKFTNEEGKITVNLDENKESNMIIIEISDTGMGIPKDKQEIIFERFGQVDSNLSRHAEGTGIGLSLVKKLVNVLNGKIELESEPSNGSTFRITLPTNQHIEKEESQEFLDTNNRLVNALHVEFSDIYL